MRELVKFFTIFTLLSFTFLYADKSEPTFNFELKDSMGKSYKITTKTDGLTFENIKDKVILLNFFGKNCPPCIAEIPHLVEFQEKHKKDYQIIGIHVQQRMSPEELEKFVKTKKINYPVIDSDDSFGLIDFIMAKTGWQGMIPYMVLFDKKGEAVTTYLGMQDMNLLESDLQQILQSEKEK